jgi:hypothetical protein
MLAMSDSHLVETHLDDSLLAWDEISRASHGDVADAQSKASGLVAYIRYVENLLATGAVAPLSAAPRGIRPTTLPVADLGPDAANQNARELYILDGHGYLELIPLGDEGTSQWLDLGRVSH